MAENVFGAIQEFRAAQDATVTSVKAVVQQGITGQPPDPTSVTNDTLSAAVTGQQQTLVATAAQLQALTSVGTAQGNSGTNAIEAFEYLNTGGVDPTLWAAMYLAGTINDGLISVDDGHNAGMKLGVNNDPNATVDEFLHYIGPGRTSVTNWQKNTVIINTQAQGPGFFDSRRAYNYVYGRVSPDGLTWVRGGVSSFGEAKIEYRVAGGAITTLGTPPAATGITPPPGSALSLECGIGTTERGFRLTVNGQNICTAVDGSTLTGLGAGYRESGCGQKRLGLSPGSFTQYTSNDNQRATVIGSGVKIFRSSTTTLAITAGNGFAKFPGGTFDTVDSVTPDINVDPTTQEITIGTSGWYLFYLRFVYNSDTATTNSRIYSGGLYRGATLIAVMTYRGDVNGGLVVEPVDNVPVYVTAGDKFTFGFGAFSINPFVVGPGDAGGAFMYAGAVLMNNSVY